MTEIPPIPEGTPNRKILLAMKQAIEEMQATVVFSVPSQPLAPQEQATKATVRLRDDAPRRNGLVWVDDLQQWVPERKLEEPDEEQSVEETP